MINKIFKFLRKEQLNIGICLLLLAIALSNLISFVFYKDYSILTNIFLIIGIILVADFDNILKRTIKINFNRFILLFFVVYFTILSLSNISEFAGTGYSLIYNVFTIIVICAFLTRTEWDNKEDFVKIVFYVTGILSIILYFVIKKHLALSTYGITGIYDSYGKSIADRLSLTAIPLYCLVSSICHKTSKKSEVIIKIIFVIMALLAYIPLHRRGPTIELIIFFIFLLLRKAKITSKISKDTIKTAIITTITIVIISLVIITNKDIINRINNLYESIQKALATLFGGNINHYGSDPSAIIRYNNRHYILNELNNYSFFDIIFGKGYMYRYLDFPLFQITIDMGIIGAILYIINTIFNYANTLIKKIENEFDAFISFLALSGTLKCFYSGIPYSWSIYCIISIILLKDFSEKSKGKEYERKQKYIK